MHGNVVHAVPTSASGSGMCADLSPRLIGCHVMPPSSVRKAPADEMAMNIRPGLAGSSMTVCRHMPPAPGCQWGLSRGREDRELLPALPAVFGAEQRRVLDPGINCVRIGERRFEMPDPLELPGMWRAVYHW